MRGFVDFFWDRLFSELEWEGVSLCLFFVGLEFVQESLLYL